MKKIIVTLLYLVVSFAKAQDKQSVLSINPQNPSVGESVSITYTPAEGGTIFKEMNALTCEVLIDRDTLDPLLVEAVLQQEGNQWKGSFTLADKHATFMAFRVVSGEQTDDNAGLLWTAYVVDKNNKPVKGAHLSAGMLLKDGRFFTFKRSTDLDGAATELKKENKLYAPSWKATLGLWDLSWKINPKDPKIKKELDAAQAKYKNDEEKIASIISWYERLGDSAKASSLKEKEITRNPQGRLALQKRQSEIRPITDKAIRAQNIESLLRDFPSMPNRVRQSTLETLFSLYLSVGEYDKVTDVISRLEKPTCDMYNALAWSLIDKGEQLDKATTWAKKAVDMAKNPDINEKPSYMREQEWKENNKYSLTMALDTYGTGMQKQGNIDEALSYFREAFDLTQGSESDINTHYLGALMQGKKYSTAIEVAMNCIRSAKDSPEMIETLKEAYAKNMAPEKVFDSLDEASKNKFEQTLSEAQKIKRDAIMKKLTESRLNTPAPDFALKNLQGAPVALSALKGKVLIIDFWATWCGPCKMSFPFLQKVYEKYQANENVVFLVVNTWERQKDYDAQVANAKKFIEENKYTFPVLIDEKKDDQYDVVGRYDVEGIPTKFILDKKGNIAWKTVGFDNGQAMIDEMTEEIDFLLSE
jgi:thiol-disulfide isomerase/thioredoxin